MLFAVLVVASARANVVFTKVGAGADPVCLLVADAATGNLELKKGSMRIKLKDVPTTADTARTKEASKGLDNDRPTQ